MVKSRTAHWSGLLGVALLIASALPARGETLKLGNEGIYPPFSIVGADGKLSGIEPDWAREMCKRMNADCEFVVMDFKGLCRESCATTEHACARTVSQSAGA